MCRGNLVKDEESKNMVQGIVQDMTSRKEAEEWKQARDLARRSVKMQEEFMAKVSHELRTPLHAILGLTELLYDTDLNKEQAGYIGAIKQSSDFLLGIVNDLIDLARAQSGHLEIEHKPFEVHKLLLHLGTIMQFKAEEKELELRLNIDRKIPKYLIGDPLRLQQVLLNLVENAIKFTEKGWVAIDVQVMDRYEEEVRLVIKVADSGIGIPEENLESIFNLFEQVEPASGRDGGSGIGLSLSKKLIEQLGGTIMVQSKVGQGTEFVIELHCKFAGGIQTNPESSFNQTIVPSKETFTVLIAEDHPVNQLLVRSLLHKKWPNVRILIVDNGQKVLHLLEEEAVDIVLLDLQMPVMDGWEANRRIKEKYPSLPVLALTANSQIEQASFPGAEEFVDHLLKPFSSQQLYSKITRYLKYVEE